MAKVLSNEFMQNMTMEEAWKELSREYYWSEPLLEKFQAKVNWDGISESQHLLDHPYDSEVPEEDQLGSIL